MPKYIVRFKENGDEYIGSLKVTAVFVSFDENKPRVFIADGVEIELDEDIIDISEVTTETNP